MKNIVHLLLNKSAFAISLAVLLGVVMVGTGYMLYASQVNKTADTSNEADLRNGGQETSQEQEQAQTAAGDEGNESTSDDNISNRDEGSGTSNQGNTNSSNDNTNTSNDNEESGQEEPSSGPKPGPHNTGPSNPNILSAMSGTTINTNGTVLENVHISGTLTIDADNVTVRNFKIDNAGHYGINVRSGNTNILIEDGEIQDMNSAGILGSNFTARRLNIHDSGGDAVKPGSNVVVESSWLHHLGTNAGAHADAFQMTSGSNATFRGNNCDMPITEPAPYKSNACFIIQTNNGPIDDVVIENNWLNGGNYTIYVRDKGNGHGAPTNVSILNNQFGRDYNFGPLSLHGSPTLSGNVWEDTGAPIN